MALFRVRPLAWHEINAHLDYLEEEAGLETAERFLDELMSSFQVLADMPKMGFFCGFRKPSTRRLRRWPVKDFENWLIFYQATRYGVEIVHVIHGARDIEALLNK
jgi:toxin ParE1/3/4